MIIMGLMSKYNNSGAFVDVNTQGFNYVSLKDVYASEGDKPYPIKGLFINTRVSMVVKQWQLVIIFLLIYQTIA